MGDTSLLPTIWATQALRDYEARRFCSESHAWENGEIVRAEPFERRVPSQYLDRAVELFVELGDFRLVANRIGVQCTQHFRQQLSYRVKREAILQLKAHPDRSSIGLITEHEYYSGGPVYTSFDQSPQAARKLIRELQS